MPYVNIILTLFLGLFVAYWCIYLTAYLRAKNNACFVPCVVGPWYVSKPLRDTPKNKKIGFKLSVCVGARFIIYAYTHAVIFEFNIN